MNGFGLGLRRVGGHFVDADRLLPLVAMVARSAIVMVA